MRDHLLFTLYGPMQGWGALAVGEVRPASGWPTRSGLLGLLAACLGIRRGEEERLAALDRAYGLGVRVDAPGQRFTDYHTVQMPKEKRNRVFSTRRDELVTMLEPDEDLNTILSQREYLADALFTACVWQREREAPHALNELAQALRRPVFIPYLGRRACPVGLPFEPEVVSAPDVRAAFAARPVAKLPTASRIRRSEEGGAIFADAGHGCPKWDEFTVWDRVVHHGRRQFTTRVEQRLRAETGNGS